MASERCLVLGSNSCAGSHFIDYALKQGADVLATVGRLKIRNVISLTKR